VLSLVLITSFYIVLYLDPRGSEGVEVFPAHYPFQRQVEPHIHEGDKLSMSLLGTESASIPETHYPIARMTDRLLDGDRVTTYMMIWR
jgi:hypothetical protein